MLSAHPFWSLEVPRLDGQLLLTPCPGNQQVAMPLALAQLQRELRRLPWPPSAAP